MELYLKIDQDEQFEFFEKFDTLSPLRQKIWKKIVSFCRNWQVAKPSQTKIANWCGCSRSAVSEAFKIFKEWGWLALLSRGFKKSKTLLISHSKRQIDLVNRQYFKRVEATYRATHTYSTYKNITSRGKGAILKVPLELEKFKFDPKYGLKIAMVPSSILHESIKIARDLGKQGWRPDDEDGYLAGICINMAKNQGQKLDWRAYYRSLKETN